MEENKDISQIALERIKKSGMKPISKNVFNLKRVLFWSLVGFSVIVGTISFSVTLSTLFNNDWYLFDKYGLSFILKSLPYFWVVFLLIFTFLGEIYYRKTLLGYRHRVTTIVGVYIILTVIFGVVVYLFGLGEKIEQSLIENVPVYRVVIFDKNEFWSHPELGLLSGKIIGVDGNKITIVDINNNVWIINADNATISNQAQIKVGKIIKIMGDDDNDNDGIFSADEIRPWIGVTNQSCCIVR